MKLRDKEKLEDKKVIKKFHKKNDFINLLFIVFYATIVVPLAWLSKIIGWITYFLGVLVVLYLLAIFYVFVTKEYFIFLSYISNIYKDPLVSIIDIVSFILLILFGYVMPFLIFSRLWIYFLRIGVAIETLPEFLNEQINLYHNRKVYATRYQRILAVPLAKLPQNLHDLDLSKDGDYSVYGNLVAMKFEGPQVRLTLENSGIYRDIMAFLNHLPEKSQIKLKQGTDYITYPIKLKIKIKDRVIRNIDIDFYDYWFEHPYDPEIRLINKLEPRQITKSERGWPL